MLENLSKAKLEYKKELSELWNLVVFGVSNGCLLSNNFLLELQPQSFVHYSSWMSYKTRALVE